MDQKEQNIMNKLQQICINKEFNNYKRNKSLKDRFNRWFLDFIVSNRSSILYIFKVFLIGIIHSKDQQSFGILLGFLQYQIQLTVNKLNIHSIRISNLISIGFIKSDNNEAAGFLINSFNLNMQFMIGKKRKLSKNKKLTTKSILAEA
tara:strand:+ start:229 stop:672 length:444 start_codon:yes stop_codon:yes gene_type:complete